MNVATSAELEALKRDVRILQAQAKRNGSAWMRLSKSPMGARKLRRWIDAGLIEASKIGRLLYVRVDDHDRLFEARIVTHTKPAPVALPETATAEDYATANLHLLKGGKTRAA